MDVELLCELLFIVFPCLLLFPSEVFKAIVLLISCEIQMLIRIGPFLLYLWNVHLIKFD